MKKVFLFLLACATMVIAQGPAVDVLYFHGAQRCITCRSIEKLTKEVLQENFAKELKSGKVTFTVVDISEPTSEKIAKEYKVTWSSLFVNKWDGANEKRNNLTQMGFSYAKNQPAEFKKRFKQVMDDLLK